MKKYLLQRRNSVGHAWSGLVVFFRSEAHAAFHFTVAVLVLGLAWFFSVSRIEWIVLLFAIALVITAELVNTVFEKIADFVQPDIDPRIKLIKDMAAASVLWCAFVSVVIGVLVFWPYFVDIIYRLS
ncbi:diacylglycerol kinase family protein [Membranicola marinus]|uniref:Diacylglycerol kinase family protein n=1 Tax=Membranihabitans marinus TaxID=1227546 RepID=A0A953HXA6_9BACT|nr:diacylglycerol kinase family protein [Membranihabitans marinus]MBY5957452.1 diacylglycerol kinase family protein [Membranihabitans marinus]